MAALMCYRSQPLFKAYRVLLKPEYQIVRISIRLAMSSGEGLLRTTPRDEAITVLSGMNGFKGVF